ncbi:GTP cyclohydrolase FolE2 [Pseudoalteromonas rubra]|uniref:GTP cyclohydrolase I FolE2 n=1 Tax=Pseudoalteromonas rubra TaxID=43658 RepID=A0A5S3X1U7_9GAMM|nr:GTP cyclohydrolase FolE2 [Pseudoalteromonas rubra]TMP38261.1 GTP cyclohydrolase I FolE2 [Pseudoalteromonas rubra]
MMQLPDIATHFEPDSQSPLKWVGMEKIVLPMRVRCDQSIVNINTLMDVFVSLDTGAKGIHMSRLYLLANEALVETELSYMQLDKVLKEIVASQNGLSQSAKLILKFELPLNRPALKSKYSGYNAYPIELHCEYLEGKTHCKLISTITYSSTCPCSAALSRQLLSETVEQQFATQDNIDKTQLLEWLKGPQGSVATPHSQRSYAYIEADLAGDHLPDLAHWLALFEETLATPVQTAVKREDEQAFAALNAKNLMFCEDAARRIKATLESISEVADYQFKVEHQESLHAHNAVVYDRKF